MTFFIIYNNIVQLIKPQFVLSYKVYTHHHLVSLIFKLANPPLLSYLGSSIREKF